MGHATGSPLYNTREKLISRVQRGQDECWNWDGKLHPTGYGFVNYKNKRQSAHRLFYTFFKGAIPPGMHILHSCDNRACVNPAHLSVGTIQDNLEDMRRKGRHWRTNATTCRRGHEYTPENTRIYRSSGARHCVTCSKLRHQGRLTDRINFPDKCPRNKALLEKRGFVLK